MDTKICNHIINDTFKEIQKIKKKHVKENKEKKKLNEKKIFHKAKPVKVKVRKKNEKRDRTISSAYL